MSFADEWKKENEEKKKYIEENYDSDYWYEHLIIDRELNKEPINDIKLPY